MLTLQHIKEVISREWVAWRHRECNVQGTLWLDSIGATQVLVELSQRLRLPQHDHVTLWEEVDADGVGWRSDNNMVGIGMVIHGSMYRANIGLVHLGVEDEHLLALHAFNFLDLRRNPGCLLVRLSQNQSGNPWIELLLLN